MPHKSRNTVSDIVYVTIREKITHMDYAPGQHLREDELSQELEVSRTPLRQAFYRLEAEGLVIKKTNGRIHVSPLQVEKVEEIYKVREALEGVVVKEAVPNLAQDDLENLEEIVHLMEISAKNNRLNDVLSYGSAFHHYLYLPSKNKTAIRFLEMLNSNIERYRRIRGNCHPAYNPLLVVEEHRKIFELVREGDARNAEIEMRRHIQNSLKSTKEALRAVKNKGIFNMN